MRSTRSRLGESIWQFSANTFWQPPEISEPMTTPPWPSSITQLRMMMFFEGMPAKRPVAPARPSALRPLLMAMQSSPVWKVQPSMSTFSQLSGSQPSPLGPSFQTFTLRTIMFFESRGCITQNGELTIVTPSMRMPSHWLKFTNCGRSPLPAPKMRLSISTPSSAYFSRSARPPGFCCFSGTWMSRLLGVFPLISHQVSSEPLPSMVPSPVSAMSVCL